MMLIDAEGKGQSRIRFEMAAQKRIMNGKRNQSIIVPILKLGQFSFPRKSMHHPKFSYIDPQKDQLWSLKQTEKILTVTTSRSLQDLTLEWRMMIEWVQQDLLNQMLSLQ